MKAKKSVKKSRVKPSLNRRISILSRKIRKCLEDIKTKKNLKSYKEITVEFFKLRTKLEPLLKKQREIEDKKRDKKIANMPESPPRSSEPYTLEDRFRSREKALANWYNHGSNGYGVREWQERGWRLF